LWGLEYGDDRLLEPFLYGLKSVCRYFALDNLLRQGVGALPSRSSEPFQTPILNKASGSSVVENVSILPFNVR
jgi:hypothetical protein